MVCIALVVPTLVGYSLTRASGIVEVPRVALVALPASPEVVPALALSVALVAHVALGPVLRALAGHAVREVVPAVLAPVAPVAGEPLLAQALAGPVLGADLRRRPAGVAVASCRRKCDFFFILLIYQYSVLRIMGKRLNGNFG